MKAACSGKDQAKRSANCDAKEHAKSIFHVPLPAPSCADCAEGLGNVVKFAADLRQMCGAGTHAAEKMSALLLGTSYQEIAGQFLLLQKHLHSTMDNMVSQVKTEIENYMKQLARDNMDNRSKVDDELGGQGHRPEDLQLVAKGLILMLQLQQQFFITAVEKMTYVTQNHSLGNSNGLNINTKLKGAGWLGGSQSTTSNEQSAYQGAAQSPNSGESADGKPLGGMVQDKQGQMLKANPMPNAGVKPHSSSWYKDSEKEAGSSFDGHPLAAGQMGGSHVQMDVRGQGQCHVSGGQIKSNVLPLAGSQNGSSLAQNGQVSEEEIDVVINMLSRATKYTAPPGGDPTEQPSMPTAMNLNPMAAAPVQHPPLLSKAPGSQLSGGSQYFINVAAAVAGSKEHPLKYGVRAGQHRQSDSFIADSHVNSEMKMNTWPIRPHLRDSASLWPSSDSPHSCMYTSPGVSDTASYQDTAFSYSTGGGIKYPFLPGFAPGPWSSAPEANVSKAWPLFPLVKDGEMITSQWAGLADSSSCSDESSSNSDMQWMMGVNLIGGINVKRRHSSGGDTAASLCVGTTNSINKSIDSLMESKSANTWPPKHPWNTRQCDGSLAQDSRDGSTFKSVHKPLTPQWSDPLATRSLAIWDTGLTGSLSQQSFSSVSVAGADLAVTGTVNLQDEEKTF